MHLHPPNNSALNPNHIQHPKHKHDHIKPTILRYKQYWISPYAYAVRALVINELTSPAWSSPSVTPGVTLGEATLHAFDFYTEQHWIWIGVAFLLGGGFVLTFAMALALARARRPVPQPFVMEGDEREFVVVGRKGAKGAEGDAKLVVEGAQKGVRRRRRGDGEKQGNGVELVAPPPAAAGGKDVDVENGAGDRSVAGGSTNAKARAGCCGGGFGGGTKQGRWEPVAAPAGAAPELPTAPQVTLVWEVRQCWMGGKGIN